MKTPEAFPDFADLIAIQNREIKRLGLTREDLREILLARYDRRSRQLLSDPDLLDLANWLQNQPAPEGSKDNVYNIEEWKSEGVPR